MSESELKKRILVMPQYATIVTLKRGIESGIISVLVNRAHITGINIDKSQPIIEDVFYELFENPSTKWMTQAYIGIEILKILDEAAEEFPRFAKTIEFWEHEIEVLKTAGEEKRTLISWMQQCIKQAKWFERWFVGGRKE